MTGARGMMLEVVNGRPRVLDWGLDRGRTSLDHRMLGAPFGAVAAGDRVLVYGRPFTVLGDELWTGTYRLVAQDSIWWAVWVTWTPTRAAIERRLIWPWLAWLWRTGRMEPAMEGCVTTIEDLWVRTWWPANQAWRRR